MSVINLYNEDCLAAMRKMPDKMYDLAIVDPEYGLNVANMSYTQETKNTALQKNGKRLRVKSSKYKIKNWDIKPVSEKWYIELKRISKNQIVFGANHMPFVMGRGRIIWNKLVSPETGFSDCEIAYQSFNERVINVYYRWAGMIQGLYCSQNIHEAIIQQGNKKLNEKRIHPTQKPVKLYKWLLHKYAKPGDKIIDTHGGSMSIAIACHDMGFDLDIWEIDKDYFEDAKLRLTNHKRELKMFEYEEMKGDMKQQFLFNF